MLPGPCSPFSGSRGAQGLAAPYVREASARGGVAQSPQRSVGHALPRVLSVEGHAQRTPHPAHVEHALHPRLGDSAGGFLVS